MKYLCACFLILTAYTTIIHAQPFFQLEPKPMYKEDVNISGADWSGFYRTYDKGIMVIIPNTDNNIQGIWASEYGGTIRFIQGKRKGNGINYSYYEYFMGNEDDDPSEDRGTGFMVMKDDGEKQNVYCKDGEGGPTEGNFTAGKKIGVALNDGAKTDSTTWVGAWKGGEKRLKDVFKIDKSEYPYTYIGFYTLEGYSSSDVQRFFSAGSWSVSFKSSEMPERTIMVLGIAYGNKLYFLSINRIEKEVNTGILTQTEKNLLLWSEQAIDDVKDLNEKEGYYWYRE